MGGAGRATRLSVKACSGRGFRQQGGRRGNAGAARSDLNLAAAALLTFRTFGFSSAFKPIRITTRRGHV